MKSCWQVCVLILLLFGAKIACYAQPRLADPAQYRTRYEWKDPYRKIERLPEPPPPKADTSTRVPEVVMKASPEISKLLELFVSDVDTVMMGYRIQIFLGEPDDATEAKFDFMEEFDDMGVYSVYESPYWKVRVGDFEDKKTAERFLMEIRDKFPSAFLVPEVIRIRY